MIAGVVVACAGGPQPQSAADLRLDMFEDVAFRREFTAARPMVIERWTGPLRIALEGSDATRYRADVQAYARLLAGLTRLDIAAARPGEAANIRMIFATLDETEVIAGPHIPDKKELEQILLTSGCLFFYDGDATHRIVRATIIIRVGRTANDSKPACWKRWCRSWGCQTIPIWCSRRSSIKRTALPRLRRWTRASSAS
mgnify:CR=1 FL=1